MSTGRWACADRIVALLEVGFTAAQAIALAEAGYGIVGWAVAA